MGCDLCGKQGFTKKTRIEGTVFNACTTCASYGTPVQEKRLKSKGKRRVDTSIVVRDAGHKIRTAREQKKMQQKDFARFLGVKESLLQNWESKRVLPTVEQARTLQKKLGLTLTQEVQEEEYVASNVSSGPLTIGDLIKRKP